MNTNFYAHEPAGTRKQTAIAQALREHAARTGQTELRILDVGCGNGHLSAFMSAVGHKVVGIDTAPEATALAGAAYPEVEFKTSSIEAIIGEFDAITAFEVCEHVPNVAAFIDQLQGRLVPGGMLLISVPNGWSLEELVRRFVQHTALGRALKRMIRGSVAPKCIGQSAADSPHVHFLGSNSWRRLFHRAGLTLEKLENVSLFFKQFYYLGGRVFIKPNSSSFNFLDKLDGQLVKAVPKFLADGWIMTWRK